MTVSELGYVSTEDIAKITKAILLSSICFIVSVVFCFNLNSYPRSVFIVDTIIIFLFLCGIRLLARLFREGFQSRNNYTAKKNILIIGAGSAGITILNEIKQGADFNPVGFVDDNPAKQGFKMRGIQVLGTCKDIPKLAALYKLTRFL